MLAAIHTRQGGRLHPKPLCQDSPFTNDETTPHSLSLTLLKSPQYKILRLLVVYESQVSYVLLSKQPLLEQVMHWPILRVGRRRRVRVLLSQVQLIRDKRLGCLTLYPLLNELVRAGIVPDFHARWE